MFSTEQIVELTAAIALENFRTRFNCALRLESDGLCTLPRDHPVRKALKQTERELRMEKPEQQMAALLEGLN